MTAQHTELSYKRFNLIKVYFGAVQYSSCVFYQLFQCSAISGDTSGSSDCEIYSTNYVMMWPTCYSDTFFNFCYFCIMLCSVEFLQHSVDLPVDGCLVAEIQQIVCQVVHYIYRRLKTIEIFKQPPLNVVAYKRWSPIRGSVYSDLT